MLIFNGVECLINPREYHYIATMSSQPRLSLYFCLFISSSLLLGGCMPDFLRAKAEYKLTGIEADKALMQEMKDFADERAGAIDTDDKKEPDALHGQNYHEKQLEDDILAKLQSEGYYDSTVSYTDGSRPWTGTYRVTAGTRYKIRNVSVTPPKYASFVEKGLKGWPLQAQTILAVQEKLYNSISKNKCFFSLGVTHEVTLDLRKKEADILFLVTVGPQATMGTVSFEGNNRVKTSYLQKLIDWKKGDCFQRQKIENLKGALFESGLFANAEMILPQKPAKDGSVPMVLHVKERAARSIQLGASYYTDEGLGVTLGWKHRNLFGSAESLDTNLKLSQKLQSAEARLTKPFFMRKDQSLSFTTSIEHDKTDGYTNHGVDVGAAIKRVFNKRLSGTTGISLSVSEVHDVALAETNNFYLVSLPQSLTYDNRNNALDATRGFLLDTHVEPFFDVSGESSSFLRTEASAQTYHALNQKTTLALRVKAGSIIGPATLEIPATKRFYAGGGSSIRGFGYQEVGPIRNGEPAGGRSVVESSAELRFKMSDTLGLVAFVDAGNVGDKSLLDVQHPSVGAGGGIRYYTDFAPLRLDLGVPLTNKDKASSSYQLYISIGQAF